MTYLGSNIFAYVGWGLRTTGLYLDGSTFKIMLRLLCSLRPCACGDYSLFV